MELNGDNKTKHDPLIKIIINTNKTNKTKNKKQTRKGKLGSKESTRLQLIKALILPI